MVISISNVLVTNDPVLMPKRCSSPKWKGKFLGNFVFGTLSRIRLLNFPIHTIRRITEKVVFLQVGQRFPGKNLELIIRSLEEPIIELNDG